ncbi:sensor histidine kinase [Flavivirga rizhaonensis]|uniref:histidine kinase n=1 Tax=Flavivirga rizhaonensis TaxID=2559571 RepID=A0A4S1E447_9FLAO|nr:HAMP domain-containing sensor histidine kinase [Flavivirga rizhaonensis]TGV04858.1 HAMP domain-containing histidine kinase [Flavivirga rizhaonensis]
MNLVNRTNKYYLIFFIFLFPLMVAVDYYLIKYVVNKEVDEILIHESERITFSLNENGELPSSSYLLSITPIDKDFPVLNNKSRDTLIYQAYKDKLVPHRTYDFGAKINSKKVKISLKHALLEMNKLIIWLFVTTTLIILLLVVGLFLINQGIYKWAWKPFFENLSKLTNYDVTKKSPVQLENSSIAEFQELNQIVTVLMDQVRKDFQNLKEFNENISHEIQTPLAIIRNKMVLLLESQNLNKKELQWVQTVYQEANKLSKIGKSLTLISRIENQEFTRLDNVDVRAVVENIVSNMEEMIAFKDLKMDVKLNPVTMKCDLILINILLTNLIKNAIQHNHERGSIKILLNEKKFEIVNTGKVSKVETAQLFNRFQRGDKTKESLGLGLAINKKICELYGFQLDYGYHDEKHKLSLGFNK